MTSANSTVIDIVDQLVEPRVIITRRMFGEHGRCGNEKFVALICDDQLLVNQPLTAEVLRNCPNGVTYPGVKPSIPGDSSL